MNTLAFGYDLPTAGRSRDFHPLECALAGRTKGGGDRHSLSPPVGKREHFRGTGLQVYTQNQITTQRSGCDLERRKSEMSAL